MKLIAIANILNGRETIGFRLLDYSNNQIKDVPLENLINILITGKAKADNIIVKGAKIEGSNGSIDRLPKLVHNQLSGRSPLIIISQLGNEGYKVADFKGCILNLRTKDVVQYAKNHGLANGKIVSKNGKELISAIKGQYHLEDIRDQKFQATKAKNRLYTGELLPDIEPLPPIVTRNIESYTVYRYSGGDVIKEYTTTLKHKINKRDIFKGVTYRTKHYTLTRKLYRVIDITDAQDRVDFINLVRIRANKENIERELIIHNNISAQWVKLKENIDKSKNSHCKVPTETIDKYIEVIKNNSIKVITEMEIDFKDIVLIRVCKTKGINYKVLHYKKRGHYDEILEVSVEQIYANHGAYGNVIVYDGEMQIVGLDGAYTYNMKRISEVYNRSIIKSTRSLKARVLGQIYEEEITANGELKQLRYNQKTIIIPNNAKYMCSKSVQLTKDNIIIVFGDTIEGCKTNFIESLGEIVNIEIGCNKAVGIKILKTIEKLKDDRTILLKYTRDITPEEYITAIYSTKTKYVIESSNLVGLNDQLVRDITDSIISNKLGNLEIVNRPIELKPIFCRPSGGFLKWLIDPKFTIFVNNFAVFKDRYEKQLRVCASKDLQDELDAVVEELGQEIEFREKEIENNRDEKNRLMKFGKLKFNTK